MRKKLPIVIVNWNGTNDTIECIKSILCSDTSLFHIYLIDNASEQKQITLLEEEFGNNSEITIIKNPRNIGFTKAHNEVWINQIRGLGTDYIALINNDTVIEQNAISEARNCAHKNKADMVSFKMIQFEERKKIDTIGHKMLTSGEIIPIGYNSPCNEHNESFEHIGPSAGACLYKVSCLEKIGFFDDFFDTGYEDAEFGFRAFITGHKLIFCPNAVIYHKGGQSIKKIYNINYSIKILRNIRYTVYKLYPYPLLILHGLFDLTRSVLIIIISLIFFKWKYIKIVFLSLKYFFTEDLKKAVAARKQFKKDNKTIGSFDIWTSQQPTLTYDLYRAYSFFIKRESSAMDSYR